MASLLRSATLAVLGIMAIAAALYLWQGSRAPAQGSFASLAQFRAAYAGVVPGMPASRLARLGFDPSQPGAQTLSYLGTMEFFMPRNSRAFDRMNPAILGCLAAKDRCGAYVFAFGGGRHKTGLFDFSAHAEPGNPQVLFLMKSGRVAYKQMMER
jgi:hypothetical protein